MNDERVFHVLIIDDDPIIGRLFESLLHKQECTTVVISDSQKAVQEAVKLQPSLILLDILMPKKDGLTVLAELKKNEATKHIPVVFLTNIDGTEERSQAKLLGAAGYFVKANITVENIKELIDTYRINKT